MLGNVPLTETQRLLDSGLVSYAPCFERLWHSQNLATFSKLAGPSLGEVSLWQLCAPQGTRVKSCAAYLLPLRGATRFP